jgi:hydroxymethylbilane synthase
VIECLAASDDVRGWLAAIDDRATRDAVLAERALLAALGGNCHSPIAVLTSPHESSITLRAAIFSPDGAERVEASETFSPADSEGPKRLAHRLLSQAPESVTVHFSGG